MLCMPARRRHAQHTLPVGRLDSRHEPVMETIPNNELQLDQVPKPEADWDLISKFALTFNGYKAWGSFEKCAEIANQERHSSLTELRTCLFFEDRRWHHYGDEPDAEAMQYICGI